MRHRKKTNKLGRTSSHRKALLQNMAAAIIEHHQIRTTLTKAKAAQGHIEKLISYAKEDSVHARRLVFKFLQNRTLVKKLFDEIATNYDNRSGGYTRVVKLGQRRGDGAPLAILQLVGFEELTVAEETPKKQKGKAKPSGKEAPAKKEKAEAAVAAEAPAAEESAEEAAEPAEKKKAAKSKPKKAKAKAGAEPEETEVAEETKAEEPKEEKAEAAEEKKPKKKTAKKEKKEDGKKKEEKE